MTRMLTVAAAQLGPIARDEPRESAVGRMVALMEEAHTKGVDLIVFPELALTTFFPRWFMDDEAELDSFYETQMPSAATRPLFDAAKRLEMAFHLGYAELVETDAGKRRFNVAMMVDKAGQIVRKYRKVHLPGHTEHEPWRPFQHLEKRYFEVGDGGFEAFRALGGVMGMCICNDRRWPETWRVLSLRGAELVMVGYNTPVHYPPVPEHDHLQDFHNHLCLQSAAYQNGLWVVGVAKAGREEGCDLIGGSCIVAPTGEIVAVAETLGDELVIAECDLDRCKEIHHNIFHFAHHRRPEHYGPITGQTGIEQPPED
ncbi:MAG: N-carbamoyl-D-amino-acid hydrolase [Myxococcota bacterium]|jgi:predicted amidohydrolase|nr:N-carbamoyl-D-amino-acid hydrolase [Myxococcota bacterium]